MNEAIFMTIIFLFIFIFIFREIKISEERQFEEMRNTVMAFEMQQLAKQNVSLMKMNKKLSERKEEE